MQPLMGLMKWKKKKSCHITLDNEEQIEHVRGTRGSSCVWGLRSRLSKQFIYLSASLWSGSSSPPHLTPGYCRIPTRPPHQPVQMIKQLTFQAHRGAATSTAKERVRWRITPATVLLILLNLSHLHEQAEVTPHSQWSGPVRRGGWGIDWGLYGTFWCCIQW